MNKKILLTSIVIGSLLFSFLWIAFWHVEVADSSLLKKRNDVSAPESSKCLETPQRNAFSIVPHYWRGKLKNLVQQLKIDTEDITVKYNPKKDESIITINDVEEKRDGMVLVIITTEEGDLKYVLE